LGLPGLLDAPADEASSDGIFGIDLIGLSLKAEILN
jgi:hypothetical protein